MTVLAVVGTLLVGSAAMSECGTAGGPGLTVTQITPNTGVQGDQVTISGTGFSTAPGGTRFKFVAPNQPNATPIYVTNVHCAGSGQCTATIPPPISSGTSLVLTADLEAIVGLRASRLNPPGDQFTWKQ